MRIIYMGTPDFACPALEALARSELVDLALVVTQPDRPAGRGRKLQPPPVKRLASTLGVPVYQTPTLRTTEQRAPIMDVQADLIVVAAFGLILGRAILEAPPYGCLNLHASVLPRYRGASPIAAAILQGDRETGVTLMRMERGLDTGPMLAQTELDIIPSDTTESLTPRMANLAATLIVDSLPKIESGGLNGTTQPAGASLTRPMVKADGWIDWSRSALEAERHIRAMWSWPRAWTPLPSGEPFQIHRALVIPGISRPPGQVTVGDKGLLVSCGDGGLQVLRGQLPGGKPLEGNLLASARALQGNIVLGTGQPPDVPGPLVTPVDDHPPR